MYMHKIIINKSEEKLIPIIWKGKEKNIDYDILLTKEGASLKLLMLLIGKKNDIVKISVNVTHEKPQTKSEIIVKGVLKDDCSIDFNGLVKINKGSKLSSAWLSANLMLLSNTAKGRAIPALEILENDVKAGHAATVGKVSETEMFYLMSRGLPKTRAKKIIIQGFLNSLLEQFPKGEKYAI
jgi:Fe-S cluster assembly protein SufD